MVVHARIWLGCYMNFFLWKIWKVHFPRLTYWLCISLFFPLDAQIPDWFGGESSGSTKGNPFPLPDVYSMAQQRNVRPLNHTEMLHCYCINRACCVQKRCFTLGSPDLVWTTWLFFQQKSLGEIKQLLREAPLEENRKRELSSAIHVYFKDWLYGNDFSFICFCFIEAESI